jgi:hypothetical protein
MKHLLLWPMVLAGLGMVGFMVSVGAADVPEALEPIKIERPEPSFGMNGPLDYDSPNMEPPSFRDRAPFQAPKGTTVVSRGKPVTSSVKAPLRGNLQMLVDGDNSY